MSGFNFDDVIHLRGRHPELAEHPGFNDWLTKHGASLWHDTHMAPSGAQTVIVQSQDRRAIFAASVARDPLSPEVRGNVERTTEFDLASMSSAMSDLSAVRLLRATTPADNSTIQACSFYVLHG